MSWDLKVWVACFATSIDYADTMWEEQFFGEVRDKSTS